MMNAYLVRTEYWYKGQKIFADGNHILKEADGVAEETETIERLVDRIESNEGFGIHHSIGIRKRVFRKEWYFIVYGWNNKKYPIDNDSPLTIKTTYKEFDIPMHMLMNMSSSKVIQYLKDRGITTCPMIGGNV